MAIPIYNSMKKPQRFPFVWTTGNSHPDMFHASSSPRKRLKRLKGIYQSAQARLFF
jgi:hypothetical protein